MIAILFLPGCANEKNEYDKLLSDQDGKYTLYVVSDAAEDTINFDVLEENHIRIVNRFIVETLEGSMLKEVNTSPFYMVFDTQKKIYETENRQDLLEYLKDKQEE